MKKIVQHLKNGAIELIEAPMPLVGDHEILVKTTRSLISVGTEKMLIDFGKSNILKKAKNQPEKVREVLAKLQTDGIGPTVAAVKAKLDAPIPMGYSNVGRVVAVGNSVNGFECGQRVLSNGSHAEYVCCPANLCAIIPEEVKLIVLGGSGLILALDVQNMRAVGHRDICQLKRRL